MRYWVYGVDAASRAPRDPLFIEAVNPDGARRQAEEMGMTVEDIEPAAKRSEPTSPPTPSAASGPSAPATPPPDHPVAAALVTVFRILAAVCAVLVAINVFAVMDDSSKHGSAGTAALTGAMLQGVIVVAVLLAIAEGLRLAIAIEKNTRGRGPASAPERMRRRVK